MILLESAGVFDWVRKLAGKKAPAPLTGAPEVRRLKTYSAQSGYVYQYLYEGHRPVDLGTQYVFQVTADRKTWFPVSVVVFEMAVYSWQKANVRELTGTELYAIAKMALFQAFDDRENPEQMQCDIKVRRADLDGIIETLGLGD